MVCFFLFIRVNQKRVRRAFDEEGKKKKGGRNRSQAASWLIIEMVREKRGKKSAIAILRLTKGEGKKKVGVARRSAGQSAYYIRRGEQNGERTSMCSSLKGGKKRGEFGLHKASIPSDRFGVRKGRGWPTLGIGLRPPQKKEREKKI